MRVTAIVRNQTTVLIPLMWYVPPMPCIWFYAMTGTLYTPHGRSIWYYVIYVPPMPIMTSYTAINYTNRKYRYIRYVMDVKYAIWTSSSYHLYTYVCDLKKKEEERGMTNIVSLAAIISLAYPRRISLADTTRATSHPRSHRRSSGVFCILLRSVTVRLIFGKPAMPVSDGSRASR